MKNEHLGSSFDDFLMENFPTNNPQIWGLWIDIPPDIGGPGWIRTSDQAIMSRLR